MADQKEGREERGGRQKILDRLNSYDDELNKEARQKKKESGRQRWYEREMEIERSKRSSGF